MRESGIFSLKEGALGNLVSGKKFLIRNNKGRIKIAPTNKYSHDHLLE
jgi:hypothetical protein